MEFRPVIVCQGTGASLKLRQGTLPRKCTQVTSATISLLSYFAIFIHDPAHNDSNGLCILPDTGLTATAETSVLRFINVYSTNTHREDGNCYADKLLFFKLFACCCNLIIMIFNTNTDNEVETCYIWSRQISLKTNRKRESRDCRVTAV